MSEGFCDVDFSEASDDADPVQFFDAKIVKAKKAHMCSECGDVIAVGDRHQRVVSKFEGEFRQDRLCEACQEARNEFGYHVLGGFLWDEFRSAWEQGARIQACLNRLTTVRAKAVMQRKWSDWNDERLQRQAARTNKRPIQESPDAR